MKFGLLSGILWGLDTCILGIAFLYHPFSSALDAALVCAAVHDIISALVLITLVVARGKFSQFLQALRTKGALIICCGALMSGPVGMNAYMSSINNIGPAPTAIISAFYPAVGTFLAVFFLKESMNIQRLVALFVALAGVIMVGLQTAQGSVEGNTIIGVAAAFICVLAWGSGAVFASWGLQSTQDLDCDVALLIHELTSSLTYALIVLPLVGAWGFCGTDVSCTRQYICCRSRYCRRFVVLVLLQSNRRYRGCACDGVQYFLLRVGSHFFHRCMQLLCLIL
ncbi:EamA family transporter [Fannyhessea vaginae]|uniref:EamA family transporter n=1 Tax=Fannyhessea vaginae TaxID=82135 RepID=UPI000B336F2E|nr:EamA family transporter [Fannyhessea vaginae]